MSKAILRFALAIGGAEPVNSRARWHGLGGRRELQSILLVLFEPLNDNLRDP